MFTRRVIAVDYLDPRQPSCDCRDDLEALTHRHKSTGGGGDDGGCIIMVVVVVVVVVVVSPSWPPPSLPPTTDGGGGGGVMIPGGLSEYSGKVALPSHNLQVKI